jgi:hypothetical protein
MNRYRHPLLCTPLATQAQPPGSPASHAVGNASADHPGSGTDTVGSSDWLAERAVKPQGEAGEPGARPTGVPLPAAPRGQATESKRGQR